MSFWDPSLVVVRFKVPNFIAFALAPFGTLSAIWHSGSLLSEFSVDKHERSAYQVFGVIKIEL